jgi:hypothetical protein
MHFHLLDRHLCFCFIVLLYFAIIMRLFCCYVAFVVLLLFCFLLFGIFQFSFCFSVICVLILFFFFCILQSLVALANHKFIYVCCVVACGVLGGGVV